MSSARDDLRKAIQQVGRRPAWNALIVLLLAIGIGGSAGVLSLFDAVYFAPLPGVEPEGLRGVYRFDPREGRYGIFTYPDFIDLRQAAWQHIDLAVHLWIPALVSAQDRTPQRLRTGIVSGNFFQLLGTQAVIGRLLQPADSAVAGERPLAVISHRLWTGLFGADPRAVGQEILLNDRAYTVIGVAQAGFRGVWLDQAPQLWVPVTMQQHLLPGVDLLSPEARQLAAWIPMLGRLKPGVSPGQAQAALQAAYSRLAEGRPQQQHWQIRVLPGSSVRFWPGLRETLNRLFGLLAAVTALLLLATCATVGHLLLTRNLERRREWALRQALGASTGRLVRQAALETSLPLLLGGIGALLAGQAFVGLIPLLELGFSISLQPHLDLRYAGLTALLTLLTSALFAFSPLAGTRVRQPQAALGQDARQTAGLLSRRLQGFLVVAQVALSVVLLWCSGLLIQTVGRLLDSELGFRPEGVMAARVAFSRPDRPPAQSLALFRELRQRLAARPGVTSVAFASQRLVSQWRRLRLVAAGDAVSVEPLQSHLQIVSPGYFETLRIPIRQGRSLQRRDDEGGEPVAVINATFAERLWPGQGALGKTIQLQDEDRPRRVIGITDPVQVQRPWEGALPVVFLPFAQYPISRADFLFRTRTPGPAHLQALRSMLASLAPSALLEDVSTMEEHIAGELAQQRMAASLASSCAIAALLLAMAGIYGVFSHSVQRRRREFAVRMALGAAPVRLLRKVLRESLSLAILGSLLGVAGALSASSAISALLFGIGSRNPFTLAAVCLLMLLVALMSSYLPAQRAMRLEPASALREE